jgi:hypothetical protein
VLQVVDEAEFKARVSFYRANQVAFVARPPGGRAGLFKKARRLVLAEHADCIVLLALLMQCLAMAVSVVLACCAVPCRAVPCCAVLS